MTSDTKSIIGTIVGAALLLAGILGGMLYNQNTRFDDLRRSVSERMDVTDNNLNARIDDLRSDLGDRIDQGQANLSHRMDQGQADLGHRMDEMRTDIREIGTRLRGVEVALGQVDQRLLTLERTIIPTAPPAQ